MAKDEDKELRKVFQRYEKLLFKAANSAESETPYSYKAEFFKRVDEAAQIFKQNARRSVDRAIPEVKISQESEGVLRRAGATYETANVKLTTYVQMVSKLTASADEFKGRIQARIDEDEKNGKTTTVSELKEYINEELRSGRGMTITYSNGAQMPTYKYAEMLARTTRMETQNLSMVGKALDDGNDLVECSTISPTCPTCAKYQGRIYSISGDTPGYPALYETAFRNGYSIIHPNCRHQFFSYNPKFHTAEERAALEANTRRPFDEGDPQSEQARADYARSQMQMRQWNKELNEFAEMRKFYAERGEEAPYKNLGAFRRAYRSEEGSLSYGKSHFMRRDERQYTNFAKVIGKERLPQTLAKFQEMKYNKDKSSFELLSRERRTITDIERKDWTPTFRAKAKDTYYEFRKSGIELTDHGVARLLQRRFEKETIKDVCSNKPFNYLQDDGKRIKYYDRIAVVYAKETDEVVTILSRPSAKEVWHEIGNTNNV